MAFMGRLPSEKFSSIFALITSRRRLRRGVLGNGRTPMADPQVVIYLADLGVVRPNMRKRVGLYENSGLRMFIFAPLLTLIENA